MQDVELLKIENILISEKLKVKDIERSFLTYTLIIVAFFISILIIQFIKIKKTNNKLKIGRKYLSTANMELKLLNERKNGLIYIIGHDLRNPVMNASSLLEFIPSESDDISEETKELLFLAKSSLSNTRELLENLLIWARVQKDNISFEFKKNKLYDQIRFIIDLYENQLVQKQISIINNIGENHEATFDLNSFQTIMRNLINNAVKFAPHKSEIHLYSEYQEGNLLVVIEDQAGGFPEHLLADLNSEKRDVIEKNQIQANGLGLQLVKEFTASNKILFKVENTSKGSKISLIIPI